MACVAMERDGRDIRDREEVRWVTETSMGPILVVATQHGIRSLEFVDHQLGLSAFSLPSGPDLLLPQGFTLESLVAMIAMQMDSPESQSSVPREMGIPLEMEIPLELRGTAFQREVWGALRTIPAGTVLSYAALARQIGKPSSTRAVASACAANRIAVLIPCHRVIRSDGGLGGYRWGLDRKRELLRREASLTASQLGV